MGHMDVSTEATGTTTAAPKFSDVYLLTQFQLEGGGVQILSTIRVTEPKFLRLPNFSIQISKVFCPNLTLSILRLKD